MILTGALINTCATCPATYQAGQRCPGQCERAGIPSLPCSGKCQTPGKDFHHTIPIPALSSHFQILANNKDNANPFLLCISMSCLCGCGQRRSCWSFSHHASPTASSCGAGLLPPHCPYHAARAGDVTRACCTLAISGTRRSPPRGKKKTLPPSEQVFPVQRCRTTFTTKCKTYPQPLITCSHPR